MVSQFDEDRPVIAAGGTGDSFVDRAGLIRLEKQCVHCEWSRDVQIPCIFDASSTAD